MSTCTPTKATDLLRIIESKVRGKKHSDWFLQKAIYYMMAGILAVTGNDLCLSDFQKWKQGPVSPSVRNALSEKRNGRQLNETNTTFLISDELLNRLFDDIFTMLPQTKEELEALSYESAWKLAVADNAPIPLEEFPVCEFDEEWVRHVDRVLSDAHNQEAEKIAAGGLSAITMPTIGVK
jgi:uncharacterized phage-associated protein